MIERDRGEEIRDAKERGEKRGEKRGKERVTISAGIHQYFGKTL